MKINLISICLALAVLLPTTHTIAKSSKKKATKQAEVTKPVKSKSAYEKLFDGKSVKSVSGLFTLHLTEDKLYTEIPVDLLGRDLIITTTIDQSSTVDYGMAGQKPSNLDTYHIMFTKSDSVIYLREVGRRVFADGDDLDKALERSAVNPIVATYPIKAYSPDSSAVVIDNGAFFAGNNKNIEAFEPDGIGLFYFSNARHKPELSLIKDIRGGNDYVSVVSDMSYSVTTIFFIFPIIKDKPFTATAVRTISLLPEKTAQSRIADPRIGVIPVGYRRFNSEDGSKVEYHASRINLDKSAEPVTFYVDTLFSDVWFDAIKEGIEMWNGAFAKIGRENALKVERYSADSTFDSNSPNGFFIKYAASPYSRIITATTTDPRSGEIVGANMHIPANVTNEMRMLRFNYLSPTVASARSKSLSDNELSKIISIYAARNVASILGLAPNYASAAAYPTDSLRSATFTAQYGLCSSITSPNTFNYIAQPDDIQKGVRLVNNQLGPYDYLAIKWLYGKTGVDNDAKADSRIASKWLTEKAGDPMYYYGNYVYDFYFGDARLAYYNLGDDPFVRTEYRLANLKNFAREASSWFKGQDPDFVYRDQAIATLSNGIGEMVSYLSGYIGTVYYNEVVDGDGQKMLQAVPKEIQRKALLKILSMSEEQEWADKSPLLEGLPANISKMVQSRAVMMVFNKLGSLGRYQMNCEGAYTADEMIDDILNFTLRDVKAGRVPSEYNKSLQLAISGTAIKASKITDGAAGASRGIQQDYNLAIAPQDIAEYRMFFEQEAAVRPVSAYGNYKQRYYKADFNDHIYYGLVLRLRDVYRQAIASAPNKETRDFYRYILDNIEKALEIK